MSWDTSRRPVGKQWALCDQIGHSIGLVNVFLYD